MNPEAITAKELAEIMGKTTRGINKRAKKENWPCEIKNGRGDKAYHISTLPENIRMQIAVSRGRSSVALVEKPANIVPFSSNGRGSSIGFPIYKGIGVASAIPVGSPDLPEWKNRIALARVDLIRLYTMEKERAKGEGESKGAVSKLFIKGYNTGQLLPQLFNILGKTSVQSVDAWSGKLRKSNFDYTVLAPAWGNRLGASKVTDSEFNTALSYWLHPNRLRVSEVARLTKMTLRKRGLESQSHPDTIRRALTEWKKTHYDQFVFCREGEKALNDKCLPYIERDIGLLDVGDVLVADGHTLNFQILHPFTGKPVRMTMITWYDWASCYPVGQEIMPTENVQCVAASLRRAIMTIGKMPKVAYLDNGKAFKAKIFTSEDIDFEAAGFFGMFARLGIETIFAWPYNAQSKPVERFFGTFNEMERLMPTYTGASIQDKPAHMMRNEKLHRKMHEKKYGGWVPTVKESLQIIDAWVDEYAQRPHLGLKGLCPGEVLAAGKGPGVDEVALRFLMMSMEVKSVRRNGIRFMGRNYYDDALYGYKDRVLIRYDLDDLSRVLIFDKTGTRFVCSAGAVQSVHPVAKITGRPEDMEAVKAGIKQKRSRKKETEAVARAYVENMPSLVVLPERAPELKAESLKLKAPKLLPRAEAEYIEAEAAKMTVLELVPREPDPIYVSDSDRYEALLERDCKGESLVLDDMAFMRYYEKTNEYRTLESRFEFLRELYIAGPEEAVEMPKV